MKRLRRQLAVAFGLLGMLAVMPSPAWALTAQEIVDSVIDELDNVTDYEATVAIDFDDEERDDMSGGTLQWKRSSGTWKTKSVDGSPYTWMYISDGTWWNAGDTEVELTHIADKADGDFALRYRNGSDMFNMENILDNETWTKASGTETVNSVSCYKVYTTKSDTNYEVWIDESTTKKVIRVKATDSDDDLQWQLDYSDYSDVESTAQLPATIVTKYYLDDTLEMTATYTFSSIDINEGLADSVFECFAWE